jgi:titin
MCNDLVNNCFINGLTNGVPVSVSVKAQTAYGISALAAVDTATPNSLTEPVTNLAYTSPASRNIKLTWTSPSGATGFKIERGVTSGSSITWTDLLNTSGLSEYTDTSTPSDGIGYFYKVTPTNGNAFGQATVILATSQGPATAPQNLVVNAGDAQVTASWSAPANNGGSVVQYYAVEHAVNGSTLTWTGNETATGTSVSIPGLINSTAYVVRVRAVTSYGPGENSAASSPVTPLAVPGSVTNVVATPGTGSRVGTVTVTWSPQAGATGYVVETAETSGGIWVTSCTINNANTTTCDVNGLIAGRTYYFKVTAINGSGSGPGSQVNVTTNTLANAPVTYPTVLARIDSLTATQRSDVNSDKVDLTWAPLAGAETYTVRISADNSGIYSAVTCANVRATSCLIPGLIGGHTYTFEVNGLGLDGQNQFGQGIASTISIALALYTPPAPIFNGGGFSAPISAPVAAPLPLSATKVTAKGGDRQVQLTWEAPSDANRSSWEIESSLDGNTWTAATTAGGGSTTAAVGNLRNGTNYIFRVVPLNSAGVKNLPTLASAMPGIPSDAPAEFAAIPGDSSVILNWKAPVNSGGLAVKSYVVEQSEDGTIWIQATSVDATSLSAYIAELTNFKEYRFRVSAVTDFGKGTPALLTASPSVLPTAALTLKLVSVGPGTLTVGWDGVTGGSASTITGYKIEYSLDGLSWTTSSTTAASATSATLTGLTNGKTYQVRVSPVTATGVGASSVILGTPATRPDAVTNLAATPSSGKMTLTFTKPRNTGGLGIDYYIVEVAPAASGPWTVAIENSGSELTRIDVPALTNQKTYFFRVTAVNQVGKGAVSAVVSAAPGAAASAPALRTYVISRTAATITWGVPTDSGGKAITQYIVETSIDGKKWVTSATTNATNRRANIRLAKRAQLMRIRAVTSYGKGVPSLGVRLPGTGQ